MSARPLLAAAAAALVLAGCGSAEFTAEELIEAVNEHGAALTLGEPLAEGEDEGGVEIHSLKFISASGAAADVHASGSLLIAAGEEEALTEYHRCEQGASLVCYRAANAVLMFDDTVPYLDLERVENAIRAIGSD
jgi:hypothetical protein